MVEKKKRPLKKSCILLFVLLATLSLQAQTDDFKAFRAQMLSEYQDFRKGIMERYVEFLDAAWAEYEAMAGADLRTGFS